MDIKDHLRYGVDSSKDKKMRMEVIPKNVVIRTM